MSNVLITGGTGFLGKSLAIWLKSAGYTVTIAGRNAAQLLKAERITGCPGIAMDVSSEHSVREGIQYCKPDIIIHAAATKFVDRAEKFPMETIDINVVGTSNVARQAIIAGVQLVVGISTDKATPPIANTYGLTKALMERMFCGLDKNQQNTRFICCRYGNVAWSTGSVLCVWKNMVEKDGIIRTTGAHMRRFFFSVDDAVQLVMTTIDYAFNKEAGVVISREMKTAQLGWVAELMSNRIEKINGRPGERVDEFLVGITELTYTRSFVDEKTGVRHYVIRFNDTSTQRDNECPVTSVVSSETSARLTKEEMEQILNSPPDEVV